MRTLGSLLRTLSQSPIVMVLIMIINMVIITATVVVMVRVNSIIRDAVLLQVLVIFISIL